MLDFLQLWAQIDSRADWKTQFWDLPEVNDSYSTSLFGCLTWHAPQWHTHPCFPSLCSLTGNDTQMLRPMVKTHPWLICLVYFVFLMPPILKSKACQIRLQNTLTTYLFFPFLPLPTLDQATHPNYGALSEPDQFTCFRACVCVCVSGSVVSNSLWPHGL